MNQVWKKCAGALVALALVTGSLAGCGDKGAASSAAAGSAASTGTSSAVSSGSEASEAGTTYDYGAGLTEDGYFDGVKALDYVKLADYKSMEIPEDVSTITDEAVQAKVDSLLESYTTTEQVKDRAIVDGDTVNMDYVGSVDGVEFDNGSTGGTGTTVTIGVTTYIDDFLEQLIGHKPGDSFDVNVTFPDVYQEASLQGKDAVFKTTINYIEEKKAPEFNDAFVAENLKESKGWSTAAEAKEALKTELRDAAVSQYLWSQVEEKSEITEVPQAVTDYHLGSMKNYYETMAAQSGMDLDTFLSEQVGVDSMDALVEQNKTQLETNEKQSLILQAICEELNIKAEEVDVSAYFKDNLAVEDYSQYKDNYGMPYLNMMVRESLAKAQISQGAE